jgi:hypothetical protein
MLFEPALLSLLTLLLLAMGQDHESVRKHDPALLMKPEEIEAKIGRPLAREELKLLLDFEDYLRRHKQRSDDSDRG